MMPQCSMSGSFIRRHHGNPPVDQSQTDESVLDGEGGSRRTRGDAEFIVDGAQVLLDGAGREEELSRHLGIRQSLRNEAEDLDLARRESRRICRRGGRCGGEAFGKGGNAGERRYRAERFADCPHLIEQCPSLPHRSGGGTQRGHRQQRQGALIWRVADVGQRERSVQMCRRTLDTPRLSIEFAEQAMGGEESERLARLRGVGESALGVLAGFVHIARLPVILRPEPLPLGLAEYRTAPVKPAIMGIEPCFGRREIVVIQRECGGEPCQRKSPRQRERAGTGLRTFR